MDSEENSSQTLTFVFKSVLVSTLLSALESLVVLSMNCAIVFFLKPFFYLKKVFFLQLVLFLDLS